MPEGTPVDRVYKALLREGKDKGTAARIAQSKTHLALATGKPPKHGKLKRLQKALKKRKG
jgi:prolyl-tRNA editing enzyme YbaK/EbsC (Cys-tRNA(Pro) deacylase)